MRGTVAKRLRNVAKLLNLPDSNLVKINERGFTLKEHQSKKEMYKKFKGAYYVTK